MKVLELPIYRDYFNIYLEIIKLLSNSSNSYHKLLIEESYKTAIQIFPFINSGYNYWGTKGKRHLYNKSRILMSSLQSQLFILKKLEIINNDYFEEIENSIKYMNGLIRKIEMIPNELS
jgi:hypothetical protein